MIVEDGADEYATSPSVISPAEKALPQELGHEEGLAPTFCATSPHQAKDKEDKPGRRASNINSGAPVPPAATSEFPTNGTPPELSQDRPLDEEYLIQQLSAAQSRKDVRISRSKKAHKTAPANVTGAAAKNQREL